VTLGKTLPVASAVYASLFDRLIVLDDYDPVGKGAGAWSPVTTDRGKPGSTLDDWMALPWQGPDQMILPGFHTAAEGSLKKQGVATAGNDVFLPVCGMMACGTRTILVSRWRTGGASSYDLVREFSQELPHAAASEAWQRSVMLAMQQPLTAGQEPRLSLKATEAAPNGDHPFFWAGYLLIDTGVPGPSESDDPGAQPAAVAENAAAPEDEGAAADDPAGDDPAGEPAEGEEGAGAMPPDDDADPADDPDLELP
jgi:hypothetical protein